MLAKDLNKLSSLIKDANAWNSFIYLLEMEQEKVIARLSGKPTEYDLISIAGQYNLIQNLRKARDNSLALEKELHN